MHVIVLSCTHYMETYMFFCKRVHESTITCMFPCITPVSVHFWPPLEKGPLSRNRNCSYMAVLVDITATNTALTNGFMMSTNGFYTRRFTNLLHYPPWYATLQKYKVICCWTIYHDWFLTYHWWNHQSHPMLLEQCLYRADGTVHIMDQFPLGVKNEHWLE